MGGDEKWGLLRDCRAQRKPSGMGGLKLHLQLCPLPLGPRPAPLFPAGLLTMRTFLLHLESQPG